MDKANADLEGRINDLQKQINDLRAIVGQIGKETPATPRVAKNFREVREFLRENEDAA